MQYSVEISIEAENDITAIFRYIAEALANPLAAQKLLDEIFAGIESLSEMPNRFRAWPNEPWFSRGVRCLGINNYNIFYIVDDDVVSVLRVFYSGRDV